MGRKRTLNKNEVIVASSLVAIPLMAILIAMLTRRPKNRPLKGSMSSRQASLKTNNINLKKSTITHSHHQQMEKQKEEQEEEEEKAPLQPESPRQGFKTEEVTANPVAATTAISTNKTTSTDNDITIPAPLAVVVPSPMEPSNSVGGAMMPSPSQAPKEELSISDEARKAGQSLKELIASAIKDAKESTKGSGKRLKEETIGIGATSDSKDIRSLGENVNTLVGLFEKMIVEIRKEHYDEQIKLLQSYRDLLQTQLKVVSTRGMMASKLKPGA
jgi:hypothetical protein